MSRLGVRGFSLIELMVGIAVGMIVVAGASVMMTNQLAEHRRLTLETQVQQDLRAVADLMLRDLRRAGSRAAPQNGLWAPSTSASAVASAVTSAYANIDVDRSELNSSVLGYSYSRHKDRGKNGDGAIADQEDDLLDSATEHFGFKIDDGGILKFLIGNRWQPLTDKLVLVITSFDVGINEQQILLDDLCSKPCPVVTATCPPSQSIRRIDISLTGHAVHDASVERTIKVTSRIRNDLLGECP